MSAILIIYDWVVYWYGWTIMMKCVYSLIKLYSLKLYAMHTHRHRHTHTAVPSSVTADKMVNLKKTFSLHCAHLQ